MEHKAPSLIIVEQPKPRDHRFRYPCEGRTGVALLGVSSTQKKKTYPEVKIQNLTTRAMIVGSLVTKDGNKPHPFQLIGKSCENGIVKKTVYPRSPKAKFESLGIQCVKRADLKDALITRKNVNVDPFQNINECIEEDLQDLECKVVRLCFQAFLEDPNCPGRFIKALDPVVTENIYNKKDSNLKIMRINKDRGKAKGNDEIFLLCEKVDKDDIQIVFYQESEQGNIWMDNGLFGPTDVHYQIAIVFKTPKYQDPMIDQEIEVKMSLRRPSDGEISEPIQFIYTPEDNDLEQVGSKRRRPAPEFEKYFLNDDKEPNTSGLGPSTSVKKKLQDKIKANSKRASSQTKTPIKQESSQSPGCKCSEVCISRHQTSPLYAEQVIDETGGKLDIPQSGISLMVPPDALNKAVKISLTVVDDPSMFLSIDDDLPVVTPLVRCEPCGLHFSKSVMLNLPHCAVVDDDNTETTVVCYSGCYESESTISWRRISDSFGSLFETNLTVHIDHFGLFFFNIKRSKAKVVRVVPFLKEVEDKMLLNLWVCNDLGSLFSRLCQSEEELNFQRQGTFGSFNIYKKFKDIEVELKNISNQTLNLRRIWSGQQVKASFIIERNTDIRSIDVKIKQTLNDEVATFHLEFQVVPEETGVRDVKQIQVTECQPPLQTEATITKTGGTLEIPNTGVVLVVPPNALPEDLVRCKMQMKIICNVIGEDQGTSFSSNSSTVVELLPDNLTFQHPVKLMLPHCLVLGEAKDCSAKIFVSHHRQGDSPRWEEQSHLSYHLEDTTCTIFLESFCWVKYSVNEKIVTAKKIVLFAAAKKLLQSQIDLATIAVGFYNDLPGKGCEFLQRNPSFIVTHTKTYFFRKRRKCYPLQFSLDKIFPSGWQGSEETNKEVSYQKVASESGHALFYLLQKKENTAGNPLCVVMAMQKKGQIPVHLAAYPKGSNMDTVSSSGAHIHLPQGQAFLMTETVITQVGGTCEIPATGVVLEIPAGALPADKEECKIQLRIIPSRKVQDEVTSFSSNSSVAVELFPSDLSLQHPVKLVLPHCLKFEENADHSVRIYTKHIGEESQSQWQEQTNLKYRLEDSACIIWMDKFCCVKYALNDEIVIGKKIVLYTAARKDIPKKEIADVEVGYFPDIPGGGELLRLNPNLVTDVMNMLYFKEEQNCPLHLSLDSIVPPMLSCSFPEQISQKIPFSMVAWSIEHSYLYVFQKTDERVCNPVCRFKAIQEGDDMPVELIVQAFSQAVGIVPSSKTEVTRTPEEQLRHCFMFLKQNLDRGWRDLGRYLHLSDANLDHIHNQWKDDVGECIYQMLLIWHWNNGRRAIPQVLMEALTKMSRLDLAEKLSEIQ